MTDLIKRDDALLPCPFCGGAAELQVGEECAYVQCLIVKAHRGPFIDGDNNAAAQAITAWNTRALPAVDPAAIREAALREAAIACQSVLVDAKTYNMPQMAIGAA